jgi:hypothetical protein
MHPMLINDRPGHEQHGTSLSRARCRSMAVLAMSSSEPDNAVSRFPRFQNLIE